ncbi:MAG: hypothetical protein ACRYHQ_15190 [Janthinobacterium lividum]
MSNAHKRMAQSMDGQGAQAIVGLITSVDPKGPAVKCLIWAGMDDEYPTDWLPMSVVATFAGGGGVVAMPCPGEQVLLVPEQNDHGSYHVIGRVFSVDHPPPVSPATGAPVQPGEFGAFTKDGAYFHLAGENIYTAGKWTHTGTTTLNGDVTTTGAIVNNGHHVDSTHAHKNSGGSGVGGVPV